MLKNRIVHTTPLLLLTLGISLAACSKPDKPSLRTFATPDEAGKALQTVAKSGDRAALVAIFGADSKEILSSGDDVQDRNGLNTFVAAYEEMHRWRSMADGAQTLLVGADNYPFPSH